MKIGIDLRSLQSGRMTGVETVLWNILPHLFSFSEHQFVLFVNARGDIPVLRELKQLEQKYKNVLLIVKKIPSKVLHTSMKFLHFPAIDSFFGSIDVLWEPNILFSVYSKKVPIVQSFHDLSYKRYPEMFSFKRRLWHFAVSPKQLARCAHTIVVPSSSTERDVVSYYGVCPESIVVVPHGAPDIHVIHSGSREQVFEKYGISKPYILFVGSFEPRKNIVSLLHAYAGLRAEKRYDIPLVLAGSAGWLEKDIIATIDALKLKSFVHLVRSFNDHDKQVLYEGAEVFVYPSIFEGFGLPVLEAMTYGVPVVTGNSSALPEVVGDASILVDVHRANDIALAIDQLLQSRELREEYIFRGKKQALAFTWKKAANEMMRVFMHVIRKV